MERKLLVEMVHEKDGHLFKMLVPSDAGLGQVYDALMHLSHEVVVLMQEMLKAKEKKEEEKKEEAPKEEKAE